MAFTRAEKHYNRRVVWLSLAYAVLLMGSIYWLKHHAAHGGIDYLVAILPALPLIGIFAALGRYFVEEGDEYRRMLTIRQALIATGFTLSVGTIYGFLESAELVDRIDSFYIACLWFFGLGVGSLVNRITERGGDA
jgi:hypothetical protein